MFVDNWIYVHSENVKHGRITNFRNWCPTLNKSKKTTILCLEFWTAETDKLWNKSEEEISIIAQDELRSLNLFPSNVAIKQSYILKVAKSYPVYKTGYKKDLELVGVGYKATNQGNVIELALGYSHSIFFAVPDDLKVTTLMEKGKNPIITLEGNDKQLIGMIAAKIKSLRKTEPYKGKGIRFKGEEIRRKAGKTVAK